MRTLGQRMPSKPCDLRFRHGINLTQTLEQAPKCLIIKALVWWPGTESNRRRQPFQGCALPTELPGRFRRSYCSGGLREIVADLCHTGRFMPIWLSESHVRALLPLPELIDVTEQALAAYSGHNATQPVRTMLSIPGGVFGCMPGLLPAQGALGAKLVTVCHHNLQRGLTTHLATIVL